MDGYRGISGIRQIICIVFGLSWFLANLTLSDMTNQMEEEKKENTTQDVDLGQCNMTSEGKDFQNGYYGDTLLKPAGFNHRKDAQTYCTYTFKGVPGQRVMFHLKKLKVGNFNTEMNRCEGGHIRLWDGLRQPGRYPYPPNTLCGQYESGMISVQKYSTQPLAEVEFWVENHERHVTFSLTYKYVNIELETDSYSRQLVHDMKLSSSSVCYWTIALEDCKDRYCDVMSPGYPGIYPPNMECQYHIFTDDVTSTLQLSFSGETNHKPREFNLRESDHCRTDYMEIYDGQSTESPLIGRFCGSRAPEVTASGGHMFLVFNTGGDAPPYGRNGFYANAIAITKEWHADSHRIPNTRCDWVYNSSEGSASSPDNFLPPMTTCTYNFPIRTGYYLEVILTIYGLEPGCNGTIEITESTRIVDRICSRSIDNSQPRFQYNLTANPVRLKYFTLRGQMQSTPDIGFWLSYRHIKLPGRKTPETEESVMYQDDSTKPKDKISVSAKVSDNSSTTQSVGILLAACIILCGIVFHEIR